MLPDLRLENAPTRAGAVASSTGSCGTAVASGVSSRTVSSGPSASSVPAMMSRKRGGPSAMRAKPPGSAPLAVGTARFTSRSASLAVSVQSAANTDRSMARLPNDAEAASMLPSASRIAEQWPCPSRLSTMRCACASSRSRRPRRGSLSISRPRSPSGKMKGRKVKPTSPLLNPRRKRITAPTGPGPSPSFVRALAICRRMALLADTSPSMAWRTVCAPTSETPSALHHTMSDKPSANTIAALPETTCSRTPSSTVRSRYE